MNKPLSDHLPVVVFLTTLIVCGLAVSVRYENWFAAILLFVIATLLIIIQCYREMDDNHIELNEYRKDIEANLERQVELLEGQIDSYKKLLAFNKLDATLQPIQDAINS